MASSASSSAGAVICLEVYQNQRWWPLSKWKPGKLLPTDRCEFSSKDGKEKRSLYGEAANELLPEGFVWAPRSTWALEISSSATDEEGWRYAGDFPSKYQKKMTMGCMVRRRRWWREAVLVGAEERASRLTVDPSPPKESLPPPQTSDMNGPAPVGADGRRTPPEDRAENYPVSSEVFDPEATASSSNNDLMAAVNQNACAIAAEKGERFSLPQSFSHPTTTTPLDAEAVITKDESFALGRASHDAADFTVASRQHSSGVFMVPRHALISHGVSLTQSSASPLRSSMLAQDREDSMPSPDFSRTIVKEARAQDASDFEVPALPTLTSTTNTNIIDADDSAEGDDSSWGGRALPPVSSVSPEYDDLLQHFVSQAATTKE